MCRVHPRCVLSYELNTNVLPGPTGLAEMRGDTFYKEEI